MPTSKKTTTVKKTPCGCKDHGMHIEMPDERRIPSFDPPSYEIAMLRQRVNSLELNNRQREIDDIVAQERKFAARNSSSAFMWGIAGGVWLAVIIMKIKRSYF